MNKRFLSLIIFPAACLIVLISCEPKENKTIKDYQVLEGGKGTEIIDHFFFIGKTGNKTGVYKYDLLLKNYEEFWKADDETVILLSYSDDREYIFFLTADKLGIKRGIAFIRGIKLYRIDVEYSSVEIITEIGSAVQLFAEWVDMNYKIQLTRFDMKIASHINKTNQIYSPFGKLLKEEMEIFDFIKEGYPQFEIQRSSLISPSGNFGIKQNSDSVYLQFAGSERIVYIDSTGDKIDKVRWSDDESFVFFTTGNVKSDRTSNSAIYVYSIVKQLIVKKLSGRGNKEFLLINNLLMFDDFSGNQPTITIFDFRENKEIDIVKIKDGCGLNYVAGF